MCGTCDADCSNDCVQDCAGVWGGTEEFTDYYLDADGDGLGSGDPANICSASAPDGWVTNGDDTDDDCYSNYHDECNVCDGDNTICADCAGVPNGDSLEDNCGTCDADSSNDCVQDCAGGWGGTEEFTD